MVSLKKHDTKATRSEKTSLVFVISQSPTVYIYMTTLSQPAIRYLSRAAAQALWQDLLTKNQSV